MQNLDCAITDELGWVEEALRWLKAAPSKVCPSVNRCGKFASVYCLDLWKNLQCHILLLLPKQFAQTWWISPRFISEVTVSTTVTKSISSLWRYSDEYLENSQHSFKIKNCSRNSKEQILTRRPSQVASLYLSYFNVAIRAGKVFSVASTLFALAVHRVSENARKALLPSFMEKRFRFAS